MASLPKVADVPVFTSSQQLFYFIHDIILTKSTDEVKAYLFKIMSQKCYEENSTTSLFSWTQEWLNKLVDNHEAYKACYCPFPSVKYKSESMIHFSDKANKRMLRMTGYQENGTWKLFKIDFYPAPKSEQDNLKNMNQNCQQKPKP